MTIAAASDSAGEIQRLRRCLRDVIALSALPAAWAGFEPGRVTESVADVLMGSLELEFVYVAVPVPFAHELQPVLRSRDRGCDAPALSRLRAAIESWLHGEAGSRPPSVPDPVGDGAVQVTAVSMGHGASMGALVAGSRRPDFPSEQDRLLLGIAANQAAVVLQRLTVEHELRRSQQQLEIEQAHLQQVFTRAPAFIATLRGADHLFDMANPAYHQLVGHRQVVGKTVREALPELEGQGFHELLDQVYQSGEPFVTREMRAQLRRGREGELEEVFLNFVYQPLWDVAGAVTGIFVHGVEVTEQVHARQRIEELAQVNRTITDNATAALFMLDARGYCTFMNPAAEAMTGWTREEIRALPFHEAIHHSQPDGTVCLRGDCPLDHGGPATHVVRAHEDHFVRRDGSVFPVLVAVAPIVCDGSPTSAVVEARDITEEKQARAELQASETLLRTIIDTEPECVQLVDREGSLQHMNHSGLRMIEAASLEQMVGRCIYEFVAPQHRAAVHELNERVFAGEGATLQFEIVGLKGTRRWMETHAVPLRDEHGQITAQLAVMRDISDRKRDEEELARRAAELTERDRQKDEFLAMLAHELRNPLAPVLNAARLLQAHGAADPLILREATVIARQARHMARLLDDLLDVARITRGKIELRTQNVDLVAAVEQAIEGSRQFMEARQHRLEVALLATPLRIKADPTRLQQVIGNLLNNAAKFTDPGGEISLTFAAEHGSAVLQVRDTGIGIATDLQDRVFDLFAQGDRSLARSESGLGIGLTMVKRLVELHGGTVAVHSEGLGHGSEFTVRWPLAPVSSVRITYVPRNPRHTPGEM